MRAAGPGRTVADMELERTRTPTLLDVAEAIAPGWERQRPFVEAVCAPIRAWMVRELAPRPGDTLLELAAGAGDTGFEAATIVGDRGRLIASDFSPSMVEAARRRGAERGVANVDYRVIDAQRIDLETDSVDGALCQLGYMLMGDPAAALAETRRVLRAGGRLVLAVWGPPDRNPFFAATAAALVEHGHMPPPDPAGPGIFSMADPERTRALLADAGFEDVRVDEVGVRFAVADVDEYLTVTVDTAGPLAMVLRGLTDEQRDAVASSAERSLAPFAAAEGLEIPGVALVARAS